MTFYVTGASPDYDLAMCLEKGWAIVLSCANPACRRRVTWGQWQIAEKDQRLTLGRIADKAVCTSCGGREGHVGTVNGDWRRSPI